MSRNKIADPPTASKVHGSETASGKGGRVRRAKHADYQLVPFPITQRVIATLQRLAEHKHTIHVLTEVDVTTPRQVIQEQKARGEEPLSFTAFIAACLGKAVDEDKSVQAYRKGRNQLVLFEDVDISIVVEHEVEGHKFPLPYVVRAANHKTVRQIHHEIRAVQKLHPTKVLPIPRLAQRWPGLMLLVGRVLIRSPFYFKRSGGTCEITAVGMFGKGGGWGIPDATAYSLFLTLGGISEKPGVVDGRIAIREYLSLTISFDHDIIDGAPAARFTGRLKELIESGYGLDDFTVESEQAVAEEIAKKRESGPHQKEEA
jgi:pyruvate/2-oxoglutarate dehydrogenase complex dihydrolipoamide acyltransferase (E2) component